MIDNGAKTASLDAGGSYTIPAGYHNGSGKVTAAALSGQTSANAVASDILSGKNAWVNGVKVNGSMLSAPSYPNELTAKQMHCYGSSYTSHDGNNIYMQIPESRYYASGTWIGFSDSDLVPANIKNGVSIGSSEKPVVGTFTSDANAAASHILSGYSGYVKGSKINGSMPNRGAAGTSLNAGGSYTIPAGYHNGSGKVTANSLASQTSATAAAGHILSGKTAYVNGSRITGNIASMGGQTITPSASTQTISCSGKYMTGNITVKGMGVYQINSAGNYGYCTGPLEYGTFTTVTGMVGSIEKIYLYYGIYNGRVSNTNWNNMGKNGTYTLPMSFGIYIGSPKLDNTHHLYYTFTGKSDKWLDGSYGISHSNCLSTYMKMSYSGGTFSIVWKSTQAQVLCLSGVLITRQ